MNHPLNNVGWSEVRDRLCHVLSLLTQYLEKQLQQEKVERATVYTLMFVWNGVVAQDETAVIVFNSRKDAQDYVRKLLTLNDARTMLTELKDATMEELASYYYDTSEAHWSIRKHRITL